MEQGGFDLDFPEPSFYYKVLRKHHVKIHPRRGVKILGLWYHHPVLDEPRFQQPSARGGKYAGQWVVRSDRRDRRQVFFQDSAYGVDAPVPDMDADTAAHVVPVPARWFVGQPCTLRTDKAVTELGYRPIVPHAAGLAAVKGALASDAA
jgi:hypothetical protein